MGSWRPSAGLPSHADRRPCRPLRRGAAERRCSCWSKSIPRFSTARPLTGRVRFRGSARCRYQNQEHSVEIDLPDGSAPRLTPFREHFHATYEREYTYRLPAPVELGVFPPRGLCGGRRAAVPAKARSHGAGGEGRGERSAGRGLRGKQRPQRPNGDLLEPGMTSAQGPGHHRGGGSNRRRSYRDALQINDYTATTSSRPRAESV